MKIISGRWKGAELESPQGSETRPTLQRVKENVFNILNHASWMIPFDEVRVLDLFAGTGQLGLEALSRGAIRVCFVEHAVEIRGVLRRNIERLHAEGLTKVYSRSALSIEVMPPQSGGPFNLVFIDAPYHTGWGLQALQQALGQKWLAERVVVCLELDSEEAFTCPEGWFVQDDRTYASCRIVFMTNYPPEEDSE